MLKVMIVDDEPKLRQGLQTLIPWESLDLTVTAAAANGKEALEMMEKEPPDIALVDIRMPLMDGLQLIRRLATSGHQVQCIILSGYADFEYVKQAIKYGVAGYLLKPVDIKEMTNTLKRVRGRIEAERMKRGQARGREPGAGPAPPSHTAGSAARNPRRIEKLRNRSRLVVEQL